MLPFLRYSHLNTALWSLCQLPERENCVLGTLTAKLIAACVCFVCLSALAKANGYMVSSKKKFLSVIENFMGKLKFRDKPLLPNVT